MPGSLDTARTEYQRTSWGAACTHFATADRETPLEAEDLERWATAAYLVGRDVECAEIWVRAHQAHLDRQAVERAARCALWLAFGLLKRGDRAHGGGWLARAQRLLDSLDRECVVHGYLLIPLGLRSIGEGDVAGAYASFCRAAELAERFGDPDLTALARHSRGRVLIRLGEIDRGVTLLDEAMTAIEAHEVSPLVAGDVYCSVIEGCMEIFDLRRAREWTEALTQWCADQPDLVPYRGQCLIRRAEIMQLRGAWPDAIHEARRACEWLTRPPGEPAAGAAFYQEAELFRVRGELDEAETAYRRAHEWGKSPQPGLALLRLDQGETDAAASAIRQALKDAKSLHLRSRLLPACVEVMLAAGDREAARTAADELARIAADLDVPMFRAIAAHAEGAVLLAEGEPASALGALRRACAEWRDLDAPYEAARTEVLIGLACRELGDDDTACLELDAARATFERLGATPDLKRLNQLAPPAASSAPGPLTPREVEVLRLVATGRTNRTIARELFISEKTVARHVSNIFLKLGLSTRAAATAYAYENDLVG